MSDANRTQLAFIREAVEGTTPATPELSEMRLTSESLTFNIENIVSNELRSDRMVSDLIQVAKSVAGDVNFEFSYGTYDDFLESVLFSTAWSTVVAETARTISATITTNTFADTAMLGTLFTNVEVGDWIQVGGFVDPANNGFFQVVTNADADNVTVAQALVTEAGDADESVAMGGRIKNGVTVLSFTMEKGFLDVSEFYQFVGCRTGAMTLNLTAQEIVNGSFSFLGRASTRSAATIDNDSAITAAPQNTIFNAVGNVASVRENGAAIATPNDARSLSFTIENNLREQFAIGSDTVIGVGAGRQEITGSVQMYFGDNTVYQRYLDGTETSIDFQLDDAEGNHYIFTFPTVKFETGEILATGIDTDVFAELTWRALRDDAEAIQVRINRFVV